MLSGLSHCRSSKGACALAPAAAAVAHGSRSSPAAILSLGPVASLTSVRKRSRFGRQTHDTRVARTHLCRHFHSSFPWSAIKPQILKDVGEGITEIQIIQWYVKEGSLIEEWQPLCQYQSDKAVDDITSRYEGVVKKLYAQADDTAYTGQPLCDIDVPDEERTDEDPATETAAPPVVSESTLPATKGDTPVGSKTDLRTPSSKHARLATPAVRALLKEFGIHIVDIDGTGKEGRVLKEDVMRHITALRSAPEISTPSPDRLSAEKPVSESAELPLNDLLRERETISPLTPIQGQMYKTMTQSLTIPHFLYTDELEFDRLDAFRCSLRVGDDNRRLSPLPFIIKAVSLALTSFPILNARLGYETTATTNNGSKQQDGKPILHYRHYHNIGIAIDTLTGLYVPNIKDVQEKSVLEIANEIARLTDLARETTTVPATEGEGDRRVKKQKLTKRDLDGGTFTVSNIGSLASGTYVAPCIIPGQMGLLGVGRTKTVPVFAGATSGREDKAVKGLRTNFSWSGDHRIIDGATMAKMAETVKGYIERPETMMVTMK